MTMHIKLIINGIMQSHLYYCHCEECNDEAIPLMIKQYGLNEVLPFKIFLHFQLHFMCLFAGYPVEFFGGIGKNYPS